VTPPVLLEEAREALRLAESAPVPAASSAAEVARRARAAGDLPAGSVAERAQGLALRHAGDLGQAIAHLRQAVRLGRRSGSALLAGEARITLAFALFERGRTTPALAEIDAAVAELDGHDRARALAQRGVILAEMGRLDEAVACYRAALPVMREAGNTLGVYRVVGNRGLAHCYRHEFAAAEADLREAERLAVELDLAVAIGYVQVNLAHVLGLRGDVPGALDYLQRAEHRIRAHGAQLGRLLQDRAELLLSVRLVSETREVAELALHEYAKEHRAIKVPEARLLLAQAALLDGDVARATHQSRRAAVEFGRQGRPEWAALTRLVTLQAKVASTAQPRISTGGLQQLVDGLVAAGRPAAALEGRLVVARLLLARGHTAAGLEHLRQASLVRRRRAPATLRARGWYAEALRRYATGDSRGAATALRAGLRVLDDYRAVLGATDLRAYAAGHRTDLTDLGLRIAVADGRVGRVFEWAERRRASHVLQRPALAPEDPALADPLAELRATVSTIAEHRDGAGGGQPQAGLHRRQLELELQIRDHSRRRPGQSVGWCSEPVPVDALGAALGDCALVQYVRLDGGLHALTLVGGRLRLRGLGPMAAVDDLVERIPFALYRITRAGEPGGPGADPESADAGRTLLGHAAARLDRLLLRPLPEIGDRGLVVLPTGSLQGLPWSVLPSCAGRPVTVAPSATLWHAAASRPREAPGRVVVAAGPALPGAQAEARAVAAIYGVTPVLPPASTTHALKAALNGAAVAHLATHGRLSAENPLFSDLALCDGPLFAYDLERLERPPHTVVLAACDSGRSVVGAGDELLGLGATFLARGTTQLVASVLPLLDVETAPVMAAFHRLLAAGRPPAVALAAAQQEASTDPLTMAGAAGFSCLGAGFVTPVRSAPPAGPALALDVTGRRGWSVAEFEGEYR
jgi:tetratricopeptide (TPR) repeat protein